MGNGQDLPPEAVDGKTTESRPVEPVRVAVIATGDQSRLPSGTVAETPGEHQPNVVVTVVTPILALAIRFVNVFLPVFMGILSAALANNIITAPDFWHLVVKCASLSLAGTTMAFLKDVVTIFAKLEQKFPLLTGKV